jgi:hypothetical protein
LGCVSLYPLYGGEKNQRKNYVQVPAGTHGFVQYRLTDAYHGTVSYLIKFKIGSRFVRVRCAEAMIQLDEAGPSRTGT